MLGPTTRAVEKRGSSTVNVAGSRSTSIAGVHPVTRKLSSAGTQATGAAASQPGEVRVHVARQVVDRRRLVHCRTAYARIRVPAGSRTGSVSSRAGRRWPMISTSNRPHCSSGARRGELGRHVAERQRDAAVVGVGARGHPTDDGAVVPDRLVAEHVRRLGGSGSISR